MKKIKNKKAFSLIELLVVIIIISVIALLVGSLIMKNISGSKTTLYNTQLDTIKSAARIYMTDKILNNNTTEITIPIGELEREGLLDKNLKDPRTNKKMDECIYVNVKNVDGNYQYEVIDSPDAT